MANYQLADGSIVTRERLEAAFKAGNARIVYTHGEFKTHYSLSLDCGDIDTRGECHSVWDEVWTAKPKTLKQAIEHAYPIYNHAATA